MMIRIKAVDTLFFRDASPFTKGEDMWANGIFPPNLSTIYGALRSAYFANCIEKLKCAGDDENDPTKDLRIQGIYYEIDEEIYVPLPIDCVKFKNTMDNNVQILSIIKKRGFYSSHPTTHMLKSIQSVENIVGGLMKIEDFQKYLDNKEGVFKDILETGKLIIQEPKIGISIDSNKGASEEAMLYRVGMQRWNSLSILVGFTGLDIPEKGLMKLGAEGKAVSYSKVDFEKIMTEVGTNKNCNLFKLYLLTPAIFDKGWIPKWVKKNSENGQFIGEYKELRLKLISASIGKPISIGGFDMRKREPKPMYKAVPQGSIYYFEILEGDMKKVKRIFNNKTISDVDEKMGYGIAYVAEVSR